VGSRRRAIKLRIESGRFSELGFLSPRQEELPYEAPQVLALSRSFRSALLSEAELRWAPLMRCVSGAGACGEIGGAPKRGAGLGSCFHLLWLWWVVGGGE
jgi:hypothetical protein